MAVFSHLEKSGSGKNRSRFGEIPASEQCAVREDRVHELTGTRLGPAAVSTQESSVKHNHCCLSLRSPWGKEDSQINPELPAVKHHGNRGPF